jgi:hypothetical protein
MKKIMKKTTDSALVGIVSAILIVGLIVAVISIIQVVYVPIIMEQREAEHMDMVAKEFSSLTSVIDDQAANGRKGIPIPTFVTLGNKELPFLVSSKAFGTLEILDDPLLDTVRSLTVTNSSGSQTFPIGVITYSSDNAYYLEQSYTYEAGAMIVSQSQGNMMMIPPFFFADYNDSKDPPLTITFDVVNISSVGNKTIASGFGTYPVQTEFYNVSRNITFINVSSMTIATPFSNAWFVFINRSLIQAGLNPEGLGYKQFTLTDTGQALQLAFVSSPLFPVNVVFRIIEIRAQIGPGWVI